MIQKIQVRTGGESYSVLVGEKFFRIPDLISEFGGQKVFLITDSHVYSLYGSKLSKLLKRKGWSVSEAILPPGEQVKSLPYLNRLYHSGAAAKLERNSLVIALGGGVISDLAGFFAATYLRGLPLVNLPTTLLAQVDAAIGGKNGINLREGKNLVGTFYQPKMVVCDPDFLKTLPVREYSCGLAEMVKCGIIKDRFLFNLMAEKPKDFIKRKDSVLKKAITAAIKVKVAVVTQDVWEKKGLRQILNFGHTVGHGLESAGTYHRLNHGEAVAIGMVAESEIAYRMNLLGEADFGRIKKTISALGLTTNVTGLKLSRVWSAISYDKKKRDGKLLFVLPVRIGKTILHSDVPEKIIFDVLTNYLV